MQIPRTRAQFSDSGWSRKSPTFLAINHTDVPCHSDALKKNGKATATRFTILRPLSAGFSVAPFKFKDKKRDPDAKLLSELAYVRTEAGAMAPAISMWSYARVGKADKGPRSDVTWSLQAGNTIVLWVDEERLTQEASEPLLPPGVDAIPAFTLCVIGVQSKAMESVTNGSAVKIATVRPVGFSLHSLGSDLGLLVGDMAGARVREMEYRDKYPMLLKDLEVKDVPFVAPVSRGAVVEHGEGGVVLANWGDPSLPQVEIPTDVLLRYTNSTRLDWACALLDVAISAGALSVMVFTSEFYKGTGTRAVPLIDAEALLGAVWAAPPCAHGTDGHAVVDTGSIVEEENGTRSFIRIRVGLVPGRAAGQAATPCDDLLLCDTMPSKGFPIEFCLVNTQTAEEVRGVWRGFVNASPFGTGAATAVLGKRVRFQPMAE
jgi:hypothetical protein